jgi:hypothetical protein
MDHDLATNIEPFEAPVERVDEFKSIRRLITQNTLLQRFIAKYVDKAPPPLEVSESLDEILARLNSLISTNPPVGNREEA